MEEAQQDGTPQCLTRAAGLPGFGAPRAWSVAFGLPVVLARLAGWQGEVPRSGRHISRHVHNAPSQSVGWSGIAKRFS